MRLDFFSGRVRQHPALRSHADARPSRLYCLAPRRPSLAWRFNATTRRPESRWTLDSDEPPSARRLRRAASHAH